ncbi:MAG: DUF2459 domain-containing protein [Candidatus Binatia bacterium]
MSRGILLIALMAFACAKPMAEPHVRVAGEKAKSVAIAIHGWHSGIVVKKSDISVDSLPEIEDFSGAEYLEIGWGDWEYYQAPDPGWRSALKAALWSSRSVLHVAGFNGPVEKFFPGSEIYGIILSDDEFQRLIGFLSDTFARSDEPALSGVRPGLYGTSRFYPAKGRFHLFRNCNTWVAEALHAAGLPMNPAHVITAANLSHRVKAFGILINTGSVEVPKSSID